VVLRVRGSTGSLGKLTLQRDCRVSWRYQATILRRLFVRQAGVLSDFSLIDH
jgi:hypothetical protein